MPQTEKNAIQFNSADGGTCIHGAVYTRPDVAPQCVLQLAHGMCEYLGRYEDFAGFLAGHGVAVIGHDHLGHGGSVQSAQDLGYFGPDGRRHLLADMKTVNGIAHDRFPGLPVVLMGHSMGSFFARAYAARWPDTINGLVICGTGGPNPLVGVGIWLTALLARLKGGHYRSPLIHKIAFGAYLKRIPSPKTDYDWISRDEALVAAYNADPLCTFRFTVNGFHEMFCTLRDVSGPEWATSLPKALPTLVVAGDADPVGDYGKGVEKVYGWLQEAGLENTQLKLYPGMRHEIHNELDRQTVYEDILAFAQRVAGT